MVTVTATQAVVALSVTITLPMTLSFMSRPSGWVRRGANHSKMLLVVVLSRGRGEVNAIQLTSSNSRETQSKA